MSGVVGFPPALARSRTPTRAVVSSRAHRRTPAEDPAVRAPRSICFFTRSADPSGMGAHLVDLVEAYAPNCSVAVMCRPTEGGLRLLDRAARLGATTVPLPRPRDPSFAGVVADFLRGHPVDVFHSHVGWGWEDWDGLRVARTEGVPAVVQTHHLPFLLSHPRKRERLLRGVEPAHHLIAVSAGLRRTYERIGVPSARFTTVPNGVPARGPGPGRLAARQALDIEPDRPVVLTTGRLIKMKGQRYLIDAVPELVARFPRLVVVIVGQGPLREQLAARAAELGVGSAVRFPGHRRDARMLLDAADVFALPSRHEGMPLAAIEAMDAGLPVVATRVIGTDEVVVDGETGTLVRPEDPPALGAALAQLLGAPELRRAYGQAGRRHYLARFTLDRMAAQTAAVYERVLRASERSRR